MMPARLIVRLPRRVSGALCSVVLVLGSAPPLAQAADIPSLLTQKHCNACHDMTAKVIGPPFIAVALRHAPRRDVMVDVLARKIRLGGGGSWGIVPMVPNDNVTPDQARAIAEWILALKPPS